MERELLVTKTSVDHESNIRIQLQGELKFQTAKLTLNYLELVAHGEDDFYHTKCCAKLLCNNKNLVKCLSTTHRSVRRFATIVSFEIVLYAILAVIQRIVLIESKYCTIHNLSYLILELVRSLIIFIQLILLGLAFNVKLFKQQLFEFETIYKGMNCIILVVFVLWHEISDEIAKSSDDYPLGCKVFTISKHAFYIIDISLMIVLVICIDAWNVGSIPKFVLIMLGWIGLGYYYYYYAISFCAPDNPYQIQNDYFTISMINSDYKKSFYYLTRNAIETLLIFVFKQICVFIYNEFQLDCKWSILNIFSKCGSRKNQALSISTHPILHWKEYNRNHKVSDTIDLELGTFPQSLAASLMLQSSNSMLINNINNNCNIDHELNTMKQNEINMGAMIEVDENNDFYHKKCCQTTCVKFIFCIYHKLIRCKKHETDPDNICLFTDNLAHSFRGESVRCVSIYAIGCVFLIILFVIESIFNQCYICSIIRALLCLSMVIPVFLSFNVKLVESQFYQFEMIYKIYNVLKIFGVEIAYIAYNYNNDKFDVEETIFATILYLTGIIVVIAVSCIDAWHTSFWIKFIVLVLVIVFSLCFTWQIRYFRNQNDYFSFTIPVFYRVSNGYETEKYALETLFIFLFKQLALLIYFNKNVCFCQCSNLCQKLQCGKYPDKAVGIKVNPYVIWHNLKLNSTVVDMC